MADVTVFVATITGEGGLQAVCRAELPPDAVELCVHVDGQEFRFLRKPRWEAVDHD